MELKLINDLSILYEKRIPAKYLSAIEDFLFSASILTDIPKFLAKFTVYFLFLELFTIILILIFSLDIILILFPFLIFPIFYTYILIKQEQKATAIEKTAPDFLRQLSSILKVGLSFENAMEDISQYSSGPFYDEIKRTIIEIRMGRNFDDAWKAMAKRLNSKELERIFLIILDGRKSGSSISNVIEDISEDLRDLLALKKERKSAVMMAVIFLIISAVIASPFSLGMVSVYGSFMGEFGKTAEIVQVAPIAGQIYLIIHSFLVGLIISVIMYGDYKKGIKFSIPLVFASYGIYLAVSVIAKSFLMF